MQLLRLGGPAIRARYKGQGGRCLQELARAWVLASEHGWCWDGRGGDADDPLSLPPHGTEVFVGGVPRTATDAQLATLASETGEVHSVTLLKDPQNSMQNRGHVPFLSTYMYLLFRTSYLISTGVIISI